VSVIMSNNCYTMGVRSRRCWFPLAWLGAGTILLQLPALAQQSGCRFLLDCTPDKAPREFTVYSDVDFEGDDILPWLMNSTLDACKIACAANSNCQAFTYNVRKSVCIIKSSYGTPKPNTDAVSGSIRPVSIPSVQFKVFPGVDFPGGDIDNNGELGVSLDQCNMICFNNPRCVGFSYVRSKRWCWPKRFITSRQSNADIISGER
jgi:hypothetical protein